MDFKERISKLMSTLWSLVKIYLLFFLFDREKEELQKRHEQLKPFLYLSFHTSDSKEVVRAFKNLSSEIRADVRDALLGGCKSMFPGKPEKFYTQKVDEFLSSPLDAVRVNGDNIYPFAKALLLVQERYQGFGPED